MRSDLDLQYGRNGDREYSYRVTWFDLDGCKQINVFQSGPAARLFQACIDEADPSRGPAPMREARPVVRPIPAKHRMALFVLGVPSAVTIDRLIEIADCMLRDALVKRSARK